MSTYTSTFLSTFLPAFLLGALAVLGFAPFYLFPVAIASVAGVYWIYIARF